MKKEGLLEQALAELKLPLEKKGWSLEDQERLYTSAFGLYDQGNYSEAADLFTQLVLSEPFQEGYWRGLAAARQMEKKYEEALHGWSLVALLADKDPLPHFHAAECLTSLGNKDEAAKALKCAEERLPKDEPARALRSKIELLRQAIKR